MIVLNVHVTMHCARSFESKGPSMLNEKQSPVARNATPTPHGNANFLFALTQAKSEQNRTTLPRHSMDCHICRSVGVVLGGFGSPMECLGYIPGPRAVVFGPIQRVQVTGAPGLPPIYRHPVERDSWLFDLFWHRPVGLMLRRKIT